MEQAASTGGLQFEVVPIGAYPELQQDWLRLEERVLPSFFLSWDWISVWLDVYRPAAHVLRVEAGGTLCALALLVRGRERRHLGMLRSRTLRLHQTGRQRDDQIWIEYNGMLVARSDRARVYPGAMRYLLEHYPGWDELIVGAMAREDVDLMARGSPLWVHELWGAPCYGVDLAALRRAGTDYLGSLSRNTRYQIRRSERRYRAMGNLELESSESVSACLRDFDALGPLHLARWGAQRNQSGYANERFVAFHRELIRRAWPKGKAEVVTLRLDGELLSGFYNLLHRGRVYFYLSGVRQEHDAHLKPGLLGHAVSAQRYLDSGFDYYDFMGGDEQYKASLGRRHTRLVKVALQRPRWKFRLEHLARRLKRRLPGAADE